MSGEFWPYGISNYGNWWGQPQYPVWQSSESVSFINAHIPCKCGTQIRLQLRLDQHPLPYNFKCACGQQYQIDGGSERDTTIATK